MSAWNSLLYFYGVLGKFNDSNKPWCSIIIKIPQSKSKVVVETKLTSYVKSTVWLLEQRYNIITNEMIIGCDLFSDNKDSR